MCTPIGQRWRRRYDQRHIFRSAPCPDELKSTCDDFYKIYPARSCTRTKRTTHPSEPCWFTCHQRQELVPHLARLLEDVGICRERRYRPACEERRLHRRAQRDSRLSHAKTNHNHHCLRGQELMYEEGICAPSSQPPPPLLLKGSPNVRCNCLYYMMNGPGSQHA